ncbi:MAG TPA: hypothetical protein VFT84_04300 [Gemmatimonadales bacterium]|nr:hypothetical protein [Gemmatimonadales bacterium]
MNRMDTHSAIQRSVRPRDETRKDATMNAKIMIVGAALLAWPMAAGAQVSAEGNAALAATVEAGLPEMPVRRVIAEGEARGASAAEVDRAATSVYTRLKASADALGSAGRTQGAASSAEIEAGAEALAHGASTADLRKLRESAPTDRSIETSLQALVRLTASGLDPAEATARVAGSLRAGESDAAIARLAGGSAVASSGANVTAAAGAAAGATAGLTGASGSVMGTLNSGVGIGPIR